MHPVQKQILSQLIFNPCFPFSKLKSKEVEGNLFIYHLKQLITEGLVQKTSDGKYELNLEGKIYTDKLSLKTFKPRIQPKIATLIVCQNNQGEYLLYKRKRQPFLELVGFPYGKIHLEETTLQAAQRELEEKTGLSANLKHLGEVYLTTFKDQQLLSQMLCHIFFTEDLKGRLKQSFEAGECFWGKIESFKPEELIPGVLDVYKLIKSPSNFLFFQEFTYHL